MQHCSNASFIDEHGNTLYLGSFEKAHAARRAGEVHARAPLKWRPKSADIWEAEEQQRLYRIVRLLA